MTSNIGKNIRLLRRLRGLTLADLAEKTNVSLSYLSRIESGNRNLTEDMLTLLSSVLACHPSDIRGSYPPQNPLSAAGFHLPSVPSATSATDAQDLFHSLIDVATNLRDNTRDSARFMGMRADLPVYKQSIAAMADGPAEPPINDQNESSDHGVQNVLVRLLGPGLDQPDWIARPPELMNAPGAFGFYITEQDVSPKYYPGDVIFVHPSRPLTPGCSVFAVYTNNHIHIGQFGGWHGSHCIIRPFSASIHPYHPSSGDESGTAQPVKGAFRIVGAREI